MYLSPASYKYLINRMKTDLLHAAAGDRYLHDPL